MRQARTHADIRNEDKTGKKIYLENPTRNWCGDFAAGETQTLLRFVDRWWRCCGASYAGLLRGDRR